MKASISSNAMRHEPWKYGITKTNRDARIAIDQGFRGSSVLGSHALREATKLLKPSLDTAMHILLKKGIKIIVIMIMTDIPSIRWR